MILTQLIYSIIISQPAFSNTWQIITGQFAIWFVNDDIPACHLLLSCAGAWQHDNSSWQLNYKQMHSCGDD